MENPKFALRKPDNVSTKSVSGCAAQFTKVGQRVADGKTEANIWRVTCAAKICPVASLTVEAPTGNRQTNALVEIRNENCGISHGRPPKSK